MPCRSYDCDDKVTIDKSEYKKFKEQERLLCETGSAIVYILAIPRLNNVVKERLQPIFDKHLEHRREERDVELGKLETQLRKLLGDIERKSEEFTPSRTMRNKIKTLRNQIKEINALSENDVGFWDRNKNIF